MSVLIVGSVALDDIETPADKRKDLLGGSASYASVSASYFSPVNFVGIVGEDFPREHLEFFRSRNIDLEGLQVVPGKTFHWSGKYYEDMNSRETISVHLNVFETFSPELPASYRDSRIVLLANISPALQNHVLDQTGRAQFVIADTMDLWISTAKVELLRLLGRVDMLILNDGEARQLTGLGNLVRASKEIQKLGPRFVAVKKGEHGCLLFGPGDFFCCPAYPLEEILDPTGAGDTFAGGVAGYLARQASGREVSFADLRSAVVLGSVMASFNVEDFSLGRLRSLAMPEIEARLEFLRRCSQIAP